MARKRSTGQLALTFGDGRDELRDELLAVCRAECGVTKTHTRSYTIDDYAPDGRRIGCQSFRVTPATRVTIARAIRAWRKRSCHTR